MIQGGWPFVAWAYGLAYGGLALYGVSLWRRVDHAQKNRGDKP